MIDMKHNESLIIVIERSTWGHPYPQPDQYHTGSWVAFVELKSIHSCQNTEELFIPQDGNVLIGKLLNCGTN